MSGSGQKKRICGLCNTILRHAFENFETDVSFISNVLGGRCRRRVVDVRFRQEQLAQEVAEGKHELRVLVDSRLDGVSPSSEKAETAHQS